MKNYIITGTNAHGTFKFCPRKMDFLKAGEYPEMDITESILQECLDVAHNDPCFNCADIEVEEIDLEEVED